MVSELLGLGTALAGGIIDIASNAQASKDYKAAREKYQKSLGQYSGNEGYLNSIAQAQKGAGAAATLAGQRSAQTARGAGMSNATAALMGANQVSDAYLKDFANQQQKAYESGVENIKGQQADIGYQKQQTAYNQAKNAAIANLLGDAAGLIGNYGYDQKLDDWIKSKGGLSSIANNVGNKIKGLFKKKESAANPAWTEQNGYAGKRADGSYVNRDSNGLYTFTEGPEPLIDYNFETKLE